MTSHDYRWLGSSIQRALTEENVPVGSEARAWKQIRSENSHSKLMQSMNSHNSINSPPTVSGVPAANTPIAGNEQVSSMANSHDPVARLQTLVDPSSFFPPDKARPFTGVHLVALKPQQDWTGIQKRAAQISDLRKSQLRHAYADPLSGPTLTQTQNLTPAQFKTLQRRQARQDRRRMRVLDHEAKAAAWLKLQQRSTMQLSPPASSSSSSSDSTSEDEAKIAEREAKKAKRLAAASKKSSPLVKGKRELHVRSPPATRNLRHLQQQQQQEQDQSEETSSSSSSSSSSDDGPPLDSEEVAMRMERIAWRRTRDQIGRALNAMHIAQNTGLATKMAPATGLAALGMGAPPNNPRAGGQRGSVMVSADTRVERIQAAAAAEAVLRHEADQVAKADAARKARGREARHLSVLAKAARQEDKKEIYRSKIGSPSSPGGKGRGASMGPAHIATDANSVAAAARQAASRLLADPMKQRQLIDRAGPEELQLHSSSRDAVLQPAIIAAMKSPNRASADPNSPTKDTATGSGRNSPVKGMGQSASSVSLLAAVKEWTGEGKGLSRSDSAPVLQFGGHVIRSPSPKRWTHVQLQQPVTPAIPAAVPTTILPAVSGALPSTDTLVSPDLLNPLNNPMMQRRRGRVLPPGGLGASPLAAITAAAQPAASDVSGSDNESNTFITQPAASSSIAGSPSTIVSASIVPIAFTGAQYLPTRGSRAAAITNVLSPVSTLATQPTTLQAIAAEADQSTGTVHSLKEPPGSSLTNLPTILKPVSSMTRSHTADPLTQLSTKMSVRGPAPMEQSAVMKKLAANLAAADAEIQTMVTPEQNAKRQAAEHALAIDDPFSFLRATAPSGNQTPRLTYARKRAEKSDLASKIMMSFSHADMQNISDEIVTNGGELTKADFIRVTRRKQHGDRDFRAETEALAEMFDEIDVNGDGTLSFLEFTSYLVELAHNLDMGPMVEDNTNVNNYQSLDMVDGNIIQNEEDIPWTSLKWFDGLDSFIACEENSVRFKVLNKNLRLSQVVRGHTAPILAVEHLPFHHLLATASMDRCIKFWSCNWEKETTHATSNSLEEGGVGGAGLAAHRSSNRGRTASHASTRPSPAQPAYAEISSWSTPLPQFHLCWNKTRLCSSDSTGRILVWNVDAGSTLHSFVGHEAQVHAMLSMPTRDQLASGGGDCTVRLWDNGHGQQTGCLRKHNRPVRSLCFHAGLHLLATGGDDDFMRLWDVNSNRHINTFHFDSANWFRALPGQEPDSVIGMELLENELIVGSRRGMFRVYDLRTMKLVQTMLLPDVEGEDALSSSAGADANPGGDDGRGGGGRRKKTHTALHNSADERGDEMELDMDRLRRRAKIQLSTFSVFRDEALLAAHKARQKEAQKQRNEERAKAMEAAALTGTQAAVAEAYPDIPVELPMDPRCQLIIGASGRYLHRFGKGGSVSRNMAHDEPLLCAYFNAQSLTLFTCTAKQVKIWCALTGRLLKEYNDLLIRGDIGGGAPAGSGTGNSAAGNALITSACLDQRQRKFILGDNSANIYIFNYNTGALMHKLSNTASLSKAVLPSKQARLAAAAAAAAALNATGTQTLTTPYGARAPDANGCEVLNLHCVLNVEGAAGHGTSALLPVSGSAGSEDVSISIHILHSLSNFIHIHIDDPDHVVGSEGGMTSATAENKNGEKGSATSSSSQSSVDTKSAAPARTVLHSLSSHKADLSSIVVSDKFGLILSASGDASIVFYPFNLAGSALQRVQPWQSLDHSKFPNGPASSRTPILSICLLEPYKMFACSDSLGHIFFYYFTRDAHALIGVIRNSKKLVSLREEALAQQAAIDAENAALRAIHAASAASSTDTSRLSHEAAKIRSERAAQRILLEKSSLSVPSVDSVSGVRPGSGTKRKSSRENSPTGKSSRSSSRPHSAKDKEKEPAQMDYPPVLSMVFDSKSNVLFTSDDMGQIKGWDLNGIIFDIHHAEYRKRKWNDFSYECEKNAKMQMQQQQQPQVISTSTTATSTVATAVPSSTLTVGVSDATKSAPIPAVLGGSNILSPLILPVQPWRLPNGTYRQDDHELLTEKEIESAFHKPKVVIPPIATILGKSASKSASRVVSAANTPRKLASVVAAATAAAYTPECLAPASRTFTLTPHIIIQAHQGACNGLQLIEADVGLRALGPGGIPLPVGATPEDMAMTPIVSPAVTHRANGPDTLPPTTTGILNRNNLLAPGSASGNGHRGNQLSINSPLAGRRASLAPSTAAASSSNSTAANSPRASSASQHSRKSSIIQPNKDGFSINLSGPGGNNEESSSASKGSTGLGGAAPASSSIPSSDAKSAAAVSADKIRQWANEEWDEDSDEEKPVIPGQAQSNEPRPGSAAATAAAIAALTEAARKRDASSYGAKGTVVDPELVDIHNLPDHPKGKGRRTSVVNEMHMANFAPPEAAATAAAIIAANEKLRLADEESKVSKAKQDAAKEQLRTQVQKSSGPCLLSYGSDGCVYLFSILTGKKIGSLQQGFSVRNCPTTPPEWRFYYPIRQRQARDEKELSETMERVADSEQEAKDREAAGMIALEQVDEHIPNTLPLVRVNCGTAKRAILKSATDSPLLQVKVLRRSSSRASIDMEEKESNSLIPSRPRTSGDNIGPDMLEEGMLSGVGSDGELDSPELIHRQAHDNLVFHALEKEIDKAIKHERRKSFARSNAGRAKRDALDAVRAEQRRVKAIVTSKSMSALTPTIYAHTAAQVTTAQKALVIAPSLSSANLLTLPGSLPIPTVSSSKGESPLKSPSKHYTVTEWNATWTDYDGTIRTLDDPLDYRFSVDQYLADMLQRREQQQQRGDGVKSISTALLEASSPTPIPASPFSPISKGGRPDSAGDSDGSPHPRRPRSSSRGPAAAAALAIERGDSGARVDWSILKASVSETGTMPDEESMAKLQTATLARHKKLARAEQKRLEKEQARSEYLENESRLRLESTMKVNFKSAGGHNIKLSPRTAEGVRMRMLLSRKPEKIVTEERKQSAKRRGE
jgi:WD40 repeat protein